MTTMHDQMYDTRNLIIERSYTTHIENAREFNIDDWVLVYRCNLQVKAGNNLSLTQTQLVQSKVIKGIVSHVYKLKEPVGTHWDNVGYTTVLKAHGRRDAPPDMNEDEVQVWDVEEIGNFSTLTGVIQYRVY